MPPPTAVVLDATVGGEFSNSYVTLAEFESYLGVRGQVPPDIVSMPDAECEKTLMWATSVFDTQCFTGYAASPTQALKWPRSGMTSTTGYPLPDDVLPQQLKYAVCEQAILQAQKDPTQENAAAAAGLIGLKAGSVELKFQQGVDTTASAISSSAKALLNPSWLCATSEEMAAAAASDDFVFDML